MCHMKKETLLCLRISDSGLSNCFFSDLFYHDLIGVTYVWYMFIYFNVYAINTPEYVGSEQACPNDQVRHHFLSFSLL